MKKKEIKFRKWIYIYIRGYYDRRKIIVNLGCLHGNHLLISSFIQLEGGGLGKGGGGGNRCFSPMHVSLYWRT